MSIKLTPVPQKKNVLVIALEFMHGDADAYTTSYFTVNIPAEKSERIEEIVTFLDSNIWRLNENDDWDDHWDEDEDEDDEEDSDSNNVIENDLKVDGYDMTFFIDGIRVTVEGQGDATTDGSCAASCSLGDVVYYDAEGNAFNVAVF